MMSHITKSWFIWWKLVSSVCTRVNVCHQELRNELIVVIAVSSVVHVLVWPVLGWLCVLETQGLRCWKERSMSMMTQHMMWVSVPIDKFDFNLRDNCPHLSSGGWCEKSCHLPWKNGQDRPCEKGSHIWSAWCVKVPEGILAQKKQARWAWASPMECEVPLQCHSEWLLSVFLGFRDCLN